MVVMFNANGHSGFGKSARSCQVQCTLATQLQWIANCFVLFVEAIVKRSIDIRQRLKVFVIMRTWSYTMRLLPH